MGFPWRAHPHRLPAQRYRFFVRVRSDQPALASLTPVLHAYVLPALASLTPVLAHGHTHARGGKGANACFAGWLAFCWLACWPPAAGLLCSLLAAFFLLPSLLRLFNL